MKKKYLLILLLITIIFTFPINTLAEGESPFLGCGTLDDPYLISDADNLLTLANLVNQDDSIYADKYYLQTQDIDLSHLTEWQPIGEDYFNTFAGTYDGGGYEITGLNITFTTEVVDFGLFGCVVSGTIKNLQLTNGSITDCRDAGGIAAYLENGTIENCKSDVDITVTTDASWVYAAGIVVDTRYDCVITGCVNTGDIIVNGNSMRIGGITSVSSNNTTITGCSNEGYISGEGSLVQAGGITGLFATATDRSTVSQCYNIGSISGSAPGFNTSSAGGIVGRATKVDIDNSFNAGVVISESGGTSNAGGILGFAYSDDITIQKCYNVGQLSGQIVGGIAGSLPSVISDCYYADTCSQGIGSGSGMAVSATLEQMKLQSTFAGFDFSTVWTLGLTAETGYLLPQFQSCSPLHVSPKSVVINTSDSEMGSVQGDGSYNYLDMVTITATPNEKYIFKNWEVVDGSAILADAESASTTFMMHGTDVSVNAVFEGEKYNVVLQDTGNGSTEGSGSYSWGDTVSITATADSGSQFMYWNVVSGDVEIFDIDSSNASFVMPELDVTIEAVFEIIPPDYTYTIEDEEATITNYTGTSTTINVPTKLGGYPVTVIGDNAFFNNDTITSLVIPDNVKDISLNAFYSCDALQTVVLGNSVIDIGESAFEYCNSLTDINIPDSVENIMESAFGYCTALDSFDFGSGVTDIGMMAFFGCNNLTSITIPDSVESINRWAFRNCSKVATVTIGEGVTSIDSSAFSGCSALTGFNVSTVNMSYQDIDGVLYTRDSLTLVRYPQTILGGYNIKAGVTEICSDAFGGCSLLTSVNIPGSVTTIGDRAFSECTNLTDIVIPNSVTSMGSNIFYNCESLSNVKIGENIETIEERAFYLCTSLRRIEIPSKVTSIGDYAFYMCENLAYVYFWGAQPTYGTKVFQYLESDSKIYYHVSEAASWATYSYNKQAFCKLTKDLQDGQTPESSLAPLTNFKLSPLPEPERNGYTFEGWYKEPECQNIWDFDTDIVTDDTTLYAMWEEICNDDIVDGKLNRTYYNGNGSKNRVAIYYGLDDSTGIYRIYYYEDGVETSYKEYDTIGNIISETYLYSSGVKKKTYWYSATTGKRYAISYYSTSGKITHKKYLYSTGVTKRTYWYSTSTGKRYAISEYNTSGKITEKTYLYSTGVTKRTYWYSTSTGKKYAISEYNTSGKITEKTYLYTSGVKRKTYWYSSTTGKRYAISYYNTGGKITQKTYLYSSGVKRKTYWYSAETGKRYAISEYNTSGKITEKTYLYSNGVKKKTYWYSTSTGKRYAISYYGTNGKITHKKYLYTSGVTKKTYWYSKTTGKRYAISYYDTNGNITKKVYYNTDGSVKETIYY